MTIKDHGHQKAFVITFYSVIQSEQKHCNHKNHFRHYLHLGPPNPSTRIAS